MLMLRPDIAAAEAGGMRVGVRREAGLLGGRRHAMIS